MTRLTVEDVEEPLDRVPDADDEEAASLLRRAREDLGWLRENSDADEADLERIENQLERREAAFDHQEEYGGSLGAATNPDEEDAA